jgi:uroporphyrinogen III methyltransferase/synthase
MTLPLSGRTIVITRALSQSEEFVAALEDCGATVLSCPTIEIKEPESYERLDEAIDHLYGYDWIIFTSTNAVEFFLRRLKHLNHEISELDEARVCAIGAATAEKLREAHIHVDVVPAQAKAEGVLETLTQFVGGKEKIAGLNILLPRAAVARDLLPRTLEEAGARVDIVTSYRTTVPDDLDRGRLSAMLAGSADCIAFTSSSTVRNLALLFDTHDLSGVLADLTIACIGDVTAATAEEYGLTVHIQPAVFNVKELANEIARHYGS